MDNNIGLTTEEAKKRQSIYGKNELVVNKKTTFWRSLLQVITEPMFLLLISAAVIYFILGEPSDGFTMLIFVMGVIGIEVIQEWKTDKTLEALKDLSDPKILAWRDGIQVEISSHDLVPGDVIYISEGNKIPADGRVIKESTLCIDESSLTGEAEGVWKSIFVEKESKEFFRKDYCYAGTLVTRGSGLILIDKIGLNTEYGKIGQNAISAPQSKTPLQKQIDKLVSMSALLAIILFIFVTVVTYFNIPDHNFIDRIVESILAGVTLAMAMIPEEFPVILTVFLSMGAWRLAKKNSLVRKLPAVETLGAISVLCVDKTGTITMNQMSVHDVYSFNSKEENLLQSMKLACQIDAYDPMEKAMLRYYDESINDNINYQLIKEYAFTNEHKMMGNVYKVNDKFIISAKGSPESIIKLSNLTLKDKLKIEKKIDAMAELGLRVIAVGEMIVDKEESIPDYLHNCNLKFIGLIGLSDSPRQTVNNDIEKCYRAGIRVVMITGDNGKTASSIAKKVGIKNSDLVITGAEIDNMSDDELKNKVKEVNIFSRVIPEHKMRIVKAFKVNGEIVAMTGDGVNDAPALKYADIGIAMGKIGTQVSREAADLTLLDDNFKTIVDTISDGRRIYDNIKKAIGYVVSIHIPIALSSLIAPILGINPINLLLLPIHVVLLELVIDPTCSIVLERQPADIDIMDRPPRDANDKLLTFRSLGKSIIQGLVIFAVSFSMYILFLNTDNANVARTIGLAIILISNVLLIQVNISDYNLITTTMFRTLKDKVMFFASFGTIIIYLIIIYTPIAKFLKLAPLTLSQLALILLVSMLSVVWYEIIKIIKHFRGII